MGTLTVPSSGYVYVDANTVIYAVEHIEPYHQRLAGTLAPRIAATQFLVQ